MARLRAAILLVAASGLLLQGCMSPGRPVTQTVRVETPGCTKVSCELSNDRGSWVLPLTPGSVTVTTSNVPLKVSCREDDGVRGRAILPSSARPTTGAGAVTGGVVGGAAVGAAVGATALTFIPVLGLVTVLGGVAVGAVAGESAESTQRAMQYPELINVPMHCGSPAAAAPAGGGPLGLSVRGLLPEQAHAVGLRGRGAVLVTAVAAQGRAAAAGLQSGDVILAAGGHELADASDLEERLLAMAPDAPVALRVWRDGQVVELVLAGAPAAPR